MSKHTPGPWMFSQAEKWTDNNGKFVQWGRFDISVGSSNQSSEIYYRIGSISNVNDTEQNEANARLIAAAPDLLEALSSLASQHSESDLRADPDLHAAVKRARAAIAKATGSAA